ncbi:MAG: DNA replication/repair protein RecF [Oscillospiraceae bacterium]
MIIKKINLVNYRNINNLEILPMEKTNIIYGENAQGKTNLVEAIWLMTGNNSFRNSKTVELLNFDKDFFSVEIAFQDKKREQKAKITFSEKKKILLNGVNLKTNNELKGNFYCVVFSPSHLSFVKDGPKQRRNFLDTAISQIKPQYCSYTDTYDKLIEQRNALLKGQTQEKKEDLLIAWDIQIAKIATIISIYRNDYINKLNLLSKKIYSELSSQKETFKIKYNSSCFDENPIPTTYDKTTTEVYYKKLVENHEYDIKQGYTTCGVHRDDLEIYINDLSVKTYGSQGQQRSSILALKLAEAELLKLITGENPIILLDDVMSELDKSRQDYILNKTSGFQVFITCCEMCDNYKNENIKIFNMKKGSIIEE